MKRRVVYIILVMIISSITASSAIFVLTDRKSEDMAKAKAKSVERLIDNVAPVYIKKVNGMWMVMVGPIDSEEKISLLSKKLIINYPDMLLINDNKALKESKQESEDENNKFLKDTDIHTIQWILILFLAILGVLIMVISMRRSMHLQALHKKLEEEQSRMYEKLMRGRENV